MVTRDHKSYPALGECRIQPANCNEATSLTELLRQFYSFAMLFNTSSEGEILLSTEIQSRKGKLLIFLITAQFLVQVPSPLLHSLRQDLNPPRMIFSDTLDTLSQSLYNSNTGNFCNVRSLHSNRNGVSARLVISWVWYLFHQNEV